MNNLQDFVFEPIRNNKVKQLKLSSWDMFPAFLFYQRLEKDITQSSFKNVSQSTISKVENNEMVCNTDLFIRIMDSMGYDVILQERPRH